MNILKSIVKKVSSFITKAKKEIELSAKLKKAMKIEGGYSVETLKKFYDNAKILIDFYMQHVDEIKVCVTNGNRKIGRVMNVSLLPIFTCLTRCNGCRFFCYDIKACMQYKNVLLARVRNTVLLWCNRNAYFEQIEQRIARRRKNKFFRWHVAGDIIDGDYLQRMIDIARHHPDFIFWTYTKQYHIVNRHCDKFGKESIPGNLSIMFSQWDGIEMVNPYNFPEFRVYDDISNVTEHRCPGNCEVCLKSKTGCPYGVTSAVKKH